jgi:hypothetical protein
MNEKILFHEALDKPAGERAGFLDAACGEDRDLRRRVDVLLQATRPADELSGAADRSRESPPSMRPSPSGPALSCSLT